MSIIPEQLSRPAVGASISLDYFDLCSDGVWNERMAGVRRYLETLPSYVSD